MTGPILALKVFSSRTTDHAHPWHQVVIPVDGALSIAVDGVEEALEDDMFAIVPSNSRHVFRELAPGRFLVLDVPPAFGYRGLPDPLLAQPFRPLDDGLRHFARYAAYEANRSDLLELLAALLLGSLSVRLGDSRPAALTRALDWAKTHAATAGVEEMARAAGLSLRACHDLFRRHLGASPGQFLLDRRLDMAERLITGSTLPLAQIAFEAGFADQSALTRSLRRHRGITPGALRRAGSAQDFAG